MEDDKTFPFSGLIFEGLGKNYHFSLLPLPLLPVSSSTRSFCSEM